jgi:YbbR domain-containing protein
MIRMLSRNWGWKLLSFVLAVGLWMGLVRDPELSTMVEAPVRFRGMPRELELSGELVDRVRLEVRGPSSQLKAEDLATAAVVLSLGNVDRPGDRTYTVEASNVTLPAGVSFSRSVPAQIRLHFETRISRRAPVRVRISDPPPDGYLLVSHTAEPDSLAIVGPESSVEQVTFLDTDSISLSNVYGSADFSVNTYVADPQVRFEDPPKVVVHVVVEKAGTE